MLVAEIMQVLETKCGKYAGSNTSRKTVDVYASTVRPRTLSRPALTISVFYNRWILSW